MQKQPPAQKRPASGTMRNTSGLKKTEKQDLHTLGKELKNDKHELIKHLNSQNINASQQLRNTSQSRTTKTKPAVPSQRTGSTKGNKSMVQTGTNNTKPTLSNHSTMATTKAPLSNQSTISSNPRTTHRKMVPTQKQPVPTQQPARPASRPRTPLNKEPAPPTKQPTNITAIRNQRLTNTNQNVNKKIEGDKQKIPIDQEKAKNLKNICKSIGIEVVKAEKDTQEVKNTFQLQRQAEEEEKVELASISSDTLDEEEDQQQQLDVSHKKTLQQQLDIMVTQQAKKLLPFANDCRKIDWARILLENHHNANHIYKKQKKIRSESKQKCQDGLHDKVTKQYASLNVFLREISQFDDKNMSSSGSHKDTLPEQQHKFLQQYQSKKREHSEQLMGDIHIDIHTLINTYKQVHFGLSLPNPSNPILLKQMQHEHEQIISLDKDQSQLLDLKYMQNKHITKDMDLNGLTLTFIST